MSDQQKQCGVRSWIVFIVRWAARLIAVVLGVFVLLFMVGEGPPPLRILVPWLVVLAGFGLGWKYEALGAVFILGAFIYFNMMEYRANGHLLHFGAFHLLLLPGLSFLFCWVMDRI